MMDSIAPRRSYRSPRQRLGAALLCLGLLGGCSAHRNLETRINNQPAESLRAEARKVEGRWQVSLPLPVGDWRIETGEAQPFELLPGSPRQTLRWTVAPERWDRRDRPFTFSLKGKEGLEIPLSVKYGSLFNGPGTFFLEVLRVFARRS